VKPTDFQGFTSVGFTHPTTVRLGFWDRLLDGSALPKDHERIPTVTRKIKKPSKRRSIDVRAGSEAPPVPGVIMPSAVPVLAAKLGERSTGGVEPGNVMMRAVDQAEKPHRPDRSGGKSKNGPAPALRLFCSFSHKDEDLRSQLEVHLKLLQRKGVIASWHDRLIGAGQEWREQISKNLERADLILLLVSADFIASDYCYDIEMTRALERHEVGEALVIPVIVRDVDWSDAPFGKLQALPKNARAVRRWSDRDAAWRSVVEGIKAAAAELGRTKV
jgi:hypothetical protein